MEIHKHDLSETHLDRQLQNQLVSSIQSGHENKQTLSTPIALVLGSHKHIVERAHEQMAILFRNVCCTCEHICALHSSLHGALSVLELRPDRLSSKKTDPVATCLTSSACRQLLSGFVMQICSSSGQTKYQL